MNFHLRKFSIQILRIMKRIKTNATKKGGKVENRAIELEVDEAMKRWIESGVLPTVENGKEFYHDLKDQNPIDSVARTVLENVETRITDDLYKDILESLRGFTDDIQLEIADDVLDYVCHKWVHKTNLKSVDTLLFGMYARIKEQHDNPEKFGLSSLIINS